MNDIIVGSTCSGVCGIELGFELAGGFRTAWFIEKEPYPRAVIRKHWPNTPIYEDMRKVDYKAVEPIDLYIGGIPCQPHSLAGKRKASQDERDLKDEFLRALRELKPKVAVIENVPGILSSEKGEFIKRLLDELYNLGYWAEIHRVSARMFGARHLRRRVFIVAYSTCRGKVSEEQQGQRDGFEQSSQDVSDSTGERCGSGSLIGGEVSEEAWRSELDKRGLASGEALADSSGDGFKRRCEDALRLIRSSQTRRVQQLEGGSAQENVPNANGFGTQIQTPGRLATEQVLGSYGENGELADAHSSAFQRDSSDVLGKEEKSDRERQQDGNGSIRPSDGSCCPDAGFGWSWAVEPDVGRVAHGVPNRVDRIKALGNAVVPQVAQYIAEIIKIRLQEREQ